MRGKVGKCFQGYASRHDSVTKYLEWSSKPNSRHHAFMKDVKIWIIEHNNVGNDESSSSSCRLRSPDELRTAHQLLDKESDDERALEEDWLQVCFVECMLKV